MMSWPPFHTMFVSVLEMSPRAVPRVGNAPPGRNLMDYWNLQYTENSVKGAILLRPLDIRKREPFPLHWALP